MLMSAGLGLAGSRSRPDLTRYRCAGHGVAVRVCSRRFDAHTHGVGPPRGIEIEREWRVSRQGVQRRALLQRLKVEGNDAARSGLADGGVAFPSRAHEETPQTTARQWRFRARAAATRSGIGRPRSCAWDFRSSDWGWGCRSSRRRRRTLRLRCLWCRSRNRSRALWRLQSQAGQLLCTLVDVDSRAECASGGGRGGGSGGAGSATGAQ